MRKPEPSPTEGLTVLAGGSELQEQELRKEPYLVPELAKELGISKHTIYREIAAGRLEAQRFGRNRGTLRIPAAAVQDYKARCADAAIKPIAATA